MEKRNIVYIGNKLSKHGSTPTSVETLGELLKSDFQMKIISDKKNKLFRIMDMLFTIIKYRKSTDLILIDTYSTTNFYYAYFCSLLAKFLDIPYIPILRGGDLIHRIEISPKMSNFVFKNAIVNIAPSNYLYQSFREFSFQVIYIPNSIDIDNYMFKKREKIEPKLLYVRAFSQVYNPKLAIEVMKLLVEKFPHAKLCMVGPDKDGILKEVQTLIKQYNLEKNIIITGKLDKSEWIKLSEKYDIFINTTNFDNTPISVIEAMALGLPVVTTNVGGIPYMLEDNVDALLVNPDNKEAMFQRVLYLLFNAKEAYRLSLKGREKAEKFAWHNIREKWVDVILESISKEKEGDV